ANVLWDVLEQCDVGLRSRDSANRASNSRAHRCAGRSGCCAQGVGCSPEGRRPGLEAIAGLVWHPLTDSGWPGLGRLVLVGADKACDCEHVVFRECPGGDRWGDVPVERIDPEQVVMHPVVLRTRPVVARVPERVGFLVRRVLAYLEAAGLARDPPPEPM